MYVIESPPIAMKSPRSGIGLASDVGDRHERRRVGWLACRRTSGDGQPRSRSRHDPNNVVL